MKINLFTLAMSVAMSSFMTVGAVAAAPQISDDGNTKKIRNIVWHNQVDINPKELVDRVIPTNHASLFFIRRQDNDPEQTSVNVSINDRFQVSLQPGSYSQVYSCAGMNHLSAKITGLKTNDLLLESSDYYLEADANYFFYVDVEPTGETSIQQITEDSAWPLLQNKKYQAHQISRVIPDCKDPVVESVPIAPLPIIVAPPIIVTPPKPIVTPPPVLEEPMSIRLEVLFDNDSAGIKPRYMSEVADVAGFMNKYRNTTAVIEGHTDSRGQAHYNQKLSERRAVSVKQALVQRYGIASNRITAVGYGESKPIANNDTDAGRRLNRRVIATIEER